MRCFFWGARQGEPLPGFPLPTHRVVPTASHSPNEFKTNEVHSAPGQLLRKQIEMSDCLGDLHSCHGNLACNDDQDVKSYR